MFRVPCGPRCIRPGSRLQGRSPPLAENLDEKVAKLHSPALGSELTVLTQEQADYFGLKVDGTFKSERYHYRDSKFSRGVFVAGSGFRRSRKEPLKALPSGFWTLAFGRLSLSRWTPLVHVELDRKQFFANELDFKIVQRDRALMPESSRTRARSAESSPSSTTSAIFCLQLRRLPFPESARCLHYTFAAVYLHSRSPVLERTTRACWEGLKGKKADNITL